MVIPLISLMALWAYAATSTIGGAFAQRAYDKENSVTGGPDLRCSTSSSRSAR